MNIIVGRTKPLIIKNKKVIGVSVAAFIKHGTANTDLANSDFLPENIIISATLTRGGRPEPIITTGNLKVLHLDSNFYNGAFEKSSPNIAVASATVLVEKAVGVFEQWLYELGFKFHGPIDLVGDDELKIEFNFQAAAVSANVSTADTTLEINEITDQWNYERFTPTFNIDPIVANEAKFEKGYSNLRDLKFINLDKTSLLTASAPISQVSLQNMMQKYTKTQNELLTDRMFAFSSKEDSDARCQCFDLYDGDVAPQTDLVLTLVSANVNANKCFVVARTGITSPRLTQLSEVRAAKHQYAKLQREGIPVSGAQLQEVNRAEMQLTK